MTYRIRTVVGIDPGVHTGMALAIDGVLREVYTVSFTNAQAILLKMRERGHLFELVIEDPRGQYVPYNQREPQRIKGVGSVERDAKLWIDWCEFNRLKYITLRPSKKTKTKLTASEFAKITGWTKKTNEHGRDAGMLVFGRRNIAEVSTGA